MVQLYRYDAKKEKWVFADYGVKSKEQAYGLQGYIIIYPKGGEKQCGTHPVKNA